MLVRLHHPHLLALIKRMVYPGKSSRTKLNDRTVHAVLPHQLVLDRVEIDVADHVEVPKVVCPVPRHPHLVVLEEKAKVELVLDGLTIVDEEPMVLP